MSKEDDLVRQYWTQLLALIGEHGHAVQAVLPTESEVGFSYTVGLAEFTGMELIVFGLPVPVAMAVLNAAASTLKEHGALPCDVVLPPRSAAMPAAINDWANSPIMVRRCLPGRAKKYAHFAYDYALMQCSDMEQPPPEFVMLQIVWPDRQGRFPEDPEFDITMVRHQPALYATPAPGEVAP